MTTYHRSGMRTFYKVTDSATIEVKNQESYSSIRIGNQHAYQWWINEDYSKVITAYEFDEALAIAKKRINEETI